MSVGTGSSRLRGAFLAHELERAAKVIVAQADDLLREAGLPFPSRAVSTVLLIGERGPITAAEIAVILDQPHQLVTQRIDLLLACGVVQRPPASTDRRRKPLELTSIGKGQVQTLLTVLTEVEQAFAGLSEEIGCDLTAMSQGLIEELSRRSLTDRVIPERKRAK